MKLLMLTDFYPPYMRGGAKYVQWLSQELKQRGHQVTVGTIGSGHTPRYEQDNGVKVWKLSGFFQKIPFIFTDPENKRHPPTKDWVITGQLRRILQEEKPDIVHIHGRILYSMLPLKKEFEIPLVSTLHGYAAICPKLTLLKKNEPTVCTKPLSSECIACGSTDYNFAKSLFAFLATKLNQDKMSQVDKFIAISSYVKQVHQQYLGLNDKEVVVIPNFYAPEVSPKLKKSEILPQDFILFVGALSALKGVNILTQAYQKLHCPSKLVVIGARHPNYQYQSQENIRVISDAPRELVINAYQKCRFAVSPSIWPEPFGIVILEAMSQRKAVIASRIGGLTDIVEDGKTGILVPPNDPEALAQAMMNLLQNPELAEAMGQKGYQRWMKLFTPEAVIPKIEQLYHEVSQS